MSVKTDDTDRRHDHVLKRESRVGFVFRFDMVVKHVWSVYSLGTD